ncbi:hypothetical protein GIS00_09465 [Nakamurella sp. YIM 132087]|uniref:Uncharacterized protein n=1 Tax=Nakamurella alba TaxID=2665158 RepID=A0A7K1FJ72_9ACTN|nr:hypothetical protein [Nakamurella alba]MTD14172.1 hypothetical protein [Nakamurella alba]
MLDVVRSLPAAQRVPIDPPSVIKDKDWSDEIGEPWAIAMTAALVGRYGPWVTGWRWALGESDLDGGPVTAWCCPRHSITSAEATLATVAAAVCEWRTWLEDLARRFAQYLPTPVDLTHDELVDLWALAIAHLITAIVERTDAGGAWYLHCATVLGWFLAVAGVAPERQESMIDAAVAGRWESWTAPHEQLVVAVAESLAARVVQELQISAIC